MEFLRGTGRPFICRDNQSISPFLTAPKVSLSEVLNRVGDFVCSLCPSVRAPACLVISAIVKADNAEEARGGGEKGNYHLKFYDKRQCKEILRNSWNNEDNEPLFSGLHF